MNRNDYVRARSNNTSAEELHILASSKEDSIVLGVAVNHSTSTKTLDMLSRHSSVEVRSLVAHHPKTSVQTLRMIALKGDTLFYPPVPTGEYSKSDSIYEHIMMRFAQNPKREELNALVDIESPFAVHGKKNLATEVQLLLEYHSVERLLSVSEEHQLEYVQQKSINYQCAHALTQSRSQSVRLALAKNWYVHPDVLILLSKDSSLQIRIATAKHSKAPIEALIVLWEMDGVSGEVAVFVAQHKNTTPELANRIVEESMDEDVLRTVAMFHMISEENQYALLKKGQFEHYLSSNKYCVPALLEEFSQDKHVYVRENVASNPNASTVVLERLSKDSEQSVRYAIALREYPVKDGATPIPSVVYKRLQVDPDLRVREMLLKNHKGYWSSEEFLQLQKDLEKHKRSLMQKGHSDFPGSSMPITVRNIDLNLIRRMCSPILEQDLLLKIEAHQVFLEHCKGGTWRNAVVAKLPLTTFTEKTSDGVQLLLRNTMVPEGTDLSGANLPLSNLTGACCEGIDVSRANLRKSSITDGLWSKTNFNGANLQYTDFSGSELRGASFVGADLTGADFEQTDCSGADFSDAILTKSKWTGALLNDIRR